MQGPVESMRVESLSEATLDTLCLALVNQGCFIIDEALPSDLVLALQREAQGLALDTLRLAGTGRETGYQLDQRVRSDRISWLQRDTATSIRYLDFAEALREGLNSRLFLGLFDYECHYACYEPGAYYAKHKDSFAGRRNRIVSTVFYLNDAWAADDGGELLLYPESGPAVPQRIAPVCNRMVCFLSERFPHEVLPARRQRYSVAGWFKVREH